ncbi:MAG: N-acetylmuramic acid 6-phosphate etherase [Candidatus Eisenbacteria sp.]|nr:N-acetylmuramic acid 6-phosphate etherase [Candidatus Eisenbacteria bacterium]
MDAGKGPSRVFREIEGLVTEGRNPDSANLDRMSVEEVLTLINREDRKVVPAILARIPEIARAVDLVVKAFLAEGRLFYVGAGTSGRLGVLDAAECPPTFGTDPEQVQGIIAGGYGALVRAVEGAEDDAAGGADALRDRNLSARDVVVGLAACRRTPFVAGALGYAREVGAPTILVTANPPDDLPVDVDVPISLVVGPEVIMGSTRMKAATAQKMVLNMLTTTAMVRLGKVYENMMVDLMATSEKLRERGKRILMISEGLSYDEAASLLTRSGGSVKLAIVMHRTGTDVKEAGRRLAEVGGWVRKAVEKRN